VFRGQALRFVRLLRCFVLRSVPFVFLRIQPISRK
jgi:hypothetical protein